MSFLRTVRHLTSRFFGVVFGRPLSPTDQKWVNDTLRRSEAALFWQQAAADQRHSAEVARRVQQNLGDNRSALAAALLHDVGKRHSNLGPIRRSLATVGDGLRLPLPAEWRRYRAHGPLGAIDLEGIGSDPLAVAFARGTMPGPEACDQPTWDALLAADDA